MPNQPGHLTWPFQIWMKFGEFVADQAKKLFPKFQIFGSSAVRNTGRQSFAKTLWPERVKALYLSSYGTYRVHSCIPWKVFERSIWVSTVGFLITINRSQKIKSKPLNLDHSKTYFFYFFIFFVLIDLIIVYNLWKNWNGFLPSFVSISFLIKTELAIFAIKHLLQNIC